MDHTPPSIDFTPDPIQAPAPFDLNAYLTLESQPEDVLPPPDTTGWRVVPATVSDERNFTAEDYDEASEGFVREGNEELAAQAAHRAFQMRKWLMTMRSGHN